MGNKKLIKQKIKRELYITKDNKLIVMEAVMNSLQYKVMNYFMIQAVECGQLKDIHVRATELIKATNSKDTSYTAVLRNLTRTIVKTSIHIEEPSTTNEKKWTDMALITKMSYENGILTCDFNDEIRPYLFGDLHSFTKSQYIYIASCKTYSAMRMYEICNSWINTTKIVYYDISKWRAILGAMGNSYLKFSHFRQRVFEPAIKEVNQKTDITIKPEYIKEGRAVTHIRLHVFSKADQPNGKMEIEKRNVTSIITKSASNVLQKPLTKGKRIEESLDGFTGLELGCLERMKTNYKLPEKIAVEYLKKYGIVYCQKQMEYTRKQHKEGNVRNIGGYLRTAIEQDYAGSKRTQEQARKAEIEEHKDKRDWNLSAVGIEKHKPGDYYPEEVEPNISRRKTNKRAQKLWNSILELSKKTNNKGMMELTGIKPFLTNVIAYKATDTELYLELPSDFVKEMFSKMYGSKLNALATRANGCETIVKISAPGQNS